MATALNIPDSDLPGIRLLRDLTPDVFANLVIAIERWSGELPSVPGIAPEDAELIMEALTSMYRFKIYAEVSVEEFVSDVCEALRELEELTPRDEPKLRDRLSKVLDIESLNIAAKAILLRLEHERWFCTARIFTDARPVYGPEVKAAPEAMIIGHVLKISYHEGNDLKDMYVALQSRDLQELSELVKRAEDKEASLRTALQATKIKLLG